ncbi:MAG: GNAT family N-acetyltransferase [Solirubrobacteraceae bacterium]
MLFVDLYLLHDGTPVEIREIRADDGERLQASHARLSPESRYRRFLGAKPSLSEADARYLVDVDGCRHYALVATTSVKGHQGEIIAVARFIALPDAPGTAEFAIVVGDAHQRQGLASGLMDRLAAAARTRGIERFRAVMLSDNVAIQRLLERLAVGDVQTHVRGTVTEMEIGLTAREAFVDLLDAAA